MKTKHLCLIIGIIPTTANKIILWMLKEVCTKLKNNEFAKISFPDHAKMAEFAAMIQVREPMVDNVIGFVDGLSLPIQCSDDEYMQNAAYMLQQRVCLFTCGKGDLLLPQLPRLLA